LAEHLGFWRIQTAQPFGLPRDPKRPWLGSDFPHFDQTDGLDASGCIISTARTVSGGHSLNLLSVNWLGQTGT
jgi:hypothetical protein